MNARQQDVWQQWKDAGWSKADLKYLLPDEYKKIFKQEQYV